MAFNLKKKNMNLIKAIKTWWKERSKVKCNYCDQRTEIWYEAYMFPIKKYKGVVVCPNCVQKTCDEANVELHKF